MPSSRSGARPAVRAGLIALVVLAVAPALAGAAPRHCASGDLRYPFETGGPKTFGVFKLRIDGGGCATAHRIAKAWMVRFEANLAEGRVRLPRSVRGWRFERLPVRAAQTYRLRGRKDDRTIRFDYVVPNG